MAQFYFRFLAVVLSLLAFIGPVSSFSQAASHTVVIENMKFDPETLRAQIGDTVIWVNKDLVPHTATDENGKFDSKTIEASKSWKMRIKKSGDFSYKCLLHPMMKARLIIDQK